MQLFTFVQEKKVEGKLLQVPAVLFTNSSHDMRSIRNLYPGLKFQSSYSIDAQRGEVPCDEILYSNLEDINLVVINAELEEKVLELEDKLRDLEKKQEVVVKLPIPNIPSNISVPLGSLGEEIIEDGEEINK